MAGQGECCSRIASVLLYIETYVKDVPYAEVEDIDLRSAKKLKQNLDDSIDKLDATSDKTPASETLDLI